MRIDLIITELNVGGAERCLVSLANFLHQGGAAVRVISLGARPIAAREQLVRELDEKKIETHFLNGLRWWQLPAVVRKLHRLVLADPPQLAQSFLFHANVVSSLVYPRQRIPLVGGVRVAEPRRWRHPIGGWSAKRMARVVCVSEGVSQWSKRVEKVPEDKRLVIPNGIELRSELEEGVRRQIYDSLAIPDQTPFLVFVGRLDAQKGFDELMKRAGSLLARLPNHHLVVVGDGALAGLCTIEPASKFRERFHFVGWQPNPRDWIAASKLLLLPARYEGMPNVVLEAMAEGCAVATMQVEGIDEIFGPGNQEQVAPLMNFDAWEEMVVALASNDAKLNDIGKRNRRIIADRFQLKDRMKDYSDLYRELLGLPPV